MKKSIVATDRSARRIALKDSPVRRVAAENIAAWLGADASGALPAKAPGPLAFAAIREEVARRLRSTGGRPGLDGAERKKIPLTQEDWERVERVAEQMAEPGFHPSPGQVASVLLSITLNRLDAPTAETAKRSLKSNPQAETP